MKTNSDLDVLVKKLEDNLAKLKATSGPEAARKDAEFVSFWNGSESGYEACINDVKNFRSLDVFKTAKVT